MDFIYKLIKFIVEAFEPNSKDDFEDIESIVDQIFPETYNP